MAKCKIGFLHIPKTSGVSIIRAFSCALGEDRCSTFHLSITDNHFDDADFVSGHVFLDDISASCYLLTFLREPVAQLVSHLRWIDHYNLPDYAEDLASLPPDIRLAVVRLHDADLSDHRDIAGFLDEFGQGAVLKIKNLQSDMLAFSRAASRPVEDRDLADRAIHNLNRFDYIGLSESLDGDMYKIFDSLDLTYRGVSHINIARSPRTIDSTVPKIRMTLESYIQADLFVYDHIRRSR